MNRLLDAQRPTSDQRADIAGRLRLIRVERFGEGGVEDLAGRIGVLAASWSNYELGVAIPGEVLLAFLVETGADPAWLLRGEGARFRSTP